MTAATRRPATCTTRIYAPNAAAIAQCESASDVQRCLAFAREHDVEVTAHSGGHSYGGYSSCPGLVIDVSPLNAISVAGAAGASGRTPVTVGAGSKLIDVYSDLAAEGLLLPGGSCPTVGIAGLALGGGVGVFSRAYGLTCDQTASVEDGDGRWCPASMRARGERGPLLGLPRRRRRQLRRCDLVRVLGPADSRGDHSLHTRVAGEAADSVLNSRIHWIPSAPDELWATCQLFSSGTGGWGSSR